MWWKWKKAINDMIKTCVLCSCFVLIFRYKIAINDMFLSYLPVGYIILCCIGYVLVRRIYYYASFTLRRFKQKDNRHNAIILLCLYLITLSIVISTSVSFDVAKFVTGSESDANISERAPVDAAGLLLKDNINSIVDSIQVSIENYNAIDESEVWLDNGAYLVGADDEPIKLINYKNATDPTYDQLINFIVNDDTDKITYDYNTFVCVDFAERVHNNAEMNGIRAGMVNMDITGTAGHACNVFNTTDRGLIFIDCTGGKSGDRLGSWDKLVSVSVDEIYRPTPIGNIHGWFYYDMGTVTNYEIDW